MEIQARILPRAERTSPALLTASLPERERQQALADLAAGYGTSVEGLLHRWEFWARPEQLLPEGDWTVAGYIAGRGAGKTRSGAEASRTASRYHRRTSLVGPTSDDVRAVMLEGESGILNLPMPKHERPIYRPSLRRLYWPNGCVTRLFSADEPDRLRGGQHEFVWCDEPAAWRRPEAWAQIKFGARIGPNPRIYVTGTPKPVTIIREIYGDENAVIVRGSSYDNRLNLAPQWFASIISMYEGTRLGRQELDAELLLDIPGAIFLWESFRYEPMPDRGELVRVVIGMDPAGGDGEDHAEMGIVVAGKHRNGAGYVLADRSARGTVQETADRVIRAYEDFEADAIIVEKNHGGDWIEGVIRSAKGGRKVHVKSVSASRSKRTRAEPIGAQYEQGKWFHVIDPDEKSPSKQKLAALEDQMTQWVPDSGMTSPDRMDALVWAATELGVTGVPPRRTPKQAATLPAEEGRRITKPRFAGVRKKTW